MPHVKPAFEFLESRTNFFRDALNPKSLLYVGWRYDGSYWWYDKFGPSLGIEKYGVLEVFPKNFADFEQACWNGRLNAEGILGDARYVDEFIPLGKWDIIYWDHGPEHVTWEDLKQCTPKLFATAGKMLLYSAPWGSWPQGEEDGNVHEVHRNSVTPEQFTELGLEFKTFGASGQQNEGEICGWKIK